MGTPFAYREINGARDDVHHHDAPAEASEPLDVSRQTITSLSMRPHLIRAKTDTSTPSGKPRLRHQHCMGALSALYLESSLENHTELSETANTDRGRSHSGIKFRYEKHRKLQASTSSVLDAHDIGEELQQERPNGAALFKKDPPERASETVAETDAERLIEPKDTAITGFEDKATLEEDRREPETEVPAGRRAASAEPKGTVIQYDAREVIKAYSAGLLRVNYGQGDTKHGDDLVPRRHRTSRVSMPEKLAPSPQLKRTTVDTSRHVDIAARKSESIAPPSERIQKLMARFDSDIKARVEADIERRRRRRQGIIFSSLFPLDKLEESLDPNKQEKQGQRPSTTGPDWAPSLHMIKAVHDMAPSDVDGMRLEGGSSAGPNGLSEQERKLSPETETPVEERASVHVGIDDPTGSSYEEASIVQAHAVAAHMVNAGKPRLIRISGHHAIYQHEASRGPLLSRPRESVYPKSHHRTNSKRHLIAQHHISDTWHQDDWNKKRQLGQAEDFSFSTDLSDGWPEEVEGDKSPPISPIDEPNPRFSYDFDKSEDGSSLVSDDYAEYKERNPSPRMPLFSMPNSPFLYHTDHDDECPSLIIDDEQDRRIEDTGPIGLDLLPLPPSPPIQREPNLDDFKDNT